MALPNRMNFRKSSEGGGEGRGGEGIFNKKYHIADFGPLQKAFFGRFQKKIAV